jgi:UDP-glucose:(heptosyl)LPS alpha-1,3-glucosyltransferase
VLLLVGSGFRTKGLDRAIEALAALPGKQRVKTRLLAVGQDNPKAFLRMAADKRLSKRVHVSPGRSDIPQLMQGADLLIHPARNELAGHVLLEAMASGLPVLVTDVCGYAFHIERAQAGVVMRSPFDQPALNKALTSMLESDHLETWAANGLVYAKAIMANNQGNAEANILMDIARHKWGGVDGPGV